MRPRVPRRHAGLPEGHGIVRPRVPRRHAGLPEGHGPKLRRQRRSVVARAMPRLDLAAHPLDLPETSSRPCAASRWLEAASCVRACRGVTQACRKDTESLILKRASSTHNRGRQLKIGSTLIRNSRMLA